MLFDIQEKLSNTIADLPPKQFLYLCLRWDPSKRVQCSKLMTHNFLKSSNTSTFAATCNVLHVTPNASSMEGIEEENEPSPQKAEWKENIDDMSTQKVEISYQASLSTLLAVPPAHLVCIYMKKFKYI